jgi:site-specific DNA-methyltransferase (adenine-specific)
MLLWVFGSGFPKSLDVSKAIDKAAGAERKVVGPPKYPGRQPNPSGNTGSFIRDDTYVFQGDKAMGQTAPATEDAKLWDGWGAGLQNLKPAVEPICYAQKPIEGTYAENTQKHGVAGLWIDGCRVELGDLEADKPSREWLG